MLTCYFLKETIGCHVWHTCFIAPSGFVHLFLRSLTWQIWVSLSVLCSHYWSSRVSSTTWNHLLPGDVSRLTLKTQSDLQSGADVWGRAAAEDITCFTSLLMCQITAWWILRRFSVTAVTAFKVKLTKYMCKSFNALNCQKGSLINYKERERCMNLISWTFSSSF